MGSLLKYWPIILSALALAGGFAVAQAKVADHDSRIVSIEKNDRDQDKALAGTGEKVNAIKETTDRIERKLDEMRRK